MKNPMIKWGIYYGLASAVLTMALFLINKNLLFDITVGLISSFALAIFFMVMALKEAKEENDGYLGYGEAVKIGLVTFVIGSLISTLVIYILYNFIDTSLYELEKEMALEAAQKMAGMFGGDEVMMEEAKAVAEEQIESMGDTKNIGSSFSDWGVSILFPGLPLALIIGAFMKKSY